MLLIVRHLGGYDLYEKPPDGGWAWAVVVSGFFNFGILFSIAKTLGVFFIDLQAAFDASVSETAWISSICLAMLGIAAPLGTMVMRKFGARKVLMASGITGCAGMILAAFAPQLWLMYIGTGIWGVAFSWGVVCTSAQLNVYFGRRKGLANGLAFSGGSIASIGLPYLAQYLLHLYGWRGAFILFAGFTLNVTMFSSLIRPISVLSPNEERKFRRINTLPKTKKPDRIKSMDVSNEVLDYMREADVEPEQPKQNSVLQFIEDYWVLSLLALAEIVVGACIFVPIIYIVPLAKEIGCSKEQATLLLSIIACGDAAFRPIGGALLTWLKCLEKYFLFTTASCFLLLAGIQVLITFATDFTALLIYLAVYGCIYGLYTAFRVVTTPILLGVENVAKFLGWKFFLSGLATLFGPPIAGSLVDIYGSIAVVFWFSAALALLTAVLYLVSGIAVERLGAVLPEHREAKKKVTNKAGESTA